MTDQTFWCPVQWGSLFKHFASCEFTYVSFLCANPSTSHKQQILLCRRCNLGPAISPGKKTQQHRMSNIITHIKAAATRCCAYRGGQRQTQTSIKPNHHASKCTDAPYHQGVNVEQIWQGGAAKQDNLLVFYRLVKAMTIRGIGHGENTSGRVQNWMQLDMCFVSCEIKRRNRGICCYKFYSFALLDTIKTASQCMSTCHSHKVSLS